MAKVIINGLKIITETIPYLPELGEFFRNERVASVKGISEKDHLYLITTMSGTGTIVSVENVI